MQSQRKNGENFMEIREKRKKVRESQQEVGGIDFKARRNRIVTKGISKVTKRL